MHWYGGSIAEAVTLFKKRNAIFVVFVEGDNELSAEMSATINDSTIVARLGDETNFLAIKLKSGSTSYTQFAQIYQFVPVPSLFFIGRNGTPLEVVGSGVKADNLATRIDRILEEHRKEKVSGFEAQPTTSSQNIKQQTVNFLQSEATPAAPTNIANPEKDEEVVSPSPPKVAKTKHHEVTHSGQEFEVVCDGDVCVRLPKAKPDEPGPSTAPTPPSSPIDVEPPPISTEEEGSIEEKVERAKKLIEIRRIEKAEKEKEVQKQKEMERRELGKGVGKLKQWQAEQTLRHIQEEKMENDQARQRILEQIAQDRAERRAREAPLPSQPQPQYSAAVPATSGDGGNRARIQFKLPDGTSHTAHFDADGTLADVHRYVADNLQLSASSFSLWSAFPRRELTESSATLRELQLTPSAALLVMTRRAAPTLAKPSPVSTIISFITQLFTSIILEPSQQLLTWIRSRLFPPPAAGARGGASPSPPQPPAPTLRRRGNIHRLPSDRPGEDDNNTWNGNSTQQM